jgi:hypothetical protein
MHVDMPHHISPLKNNFKNSRKIILTLNDIICQ